MGYVSTKYLNVIREVFCKFRRTYTILLFYQSLSLIVYRRNFMETDCTTETDHRNDYGRQIKRTQRIQYMYYLKQRMI